MRSQTHKTLQPRLIPSSIAHVPQLSRATCNRRCRHLVNPRFEGKGSIRQERAPLLPGANGSLAKLGMGRAYAMTSDIAKARTAYQNFFAVWKHADADIPILKQARAEYAKLQ